MNIFQRLADILSRRDFTAPGASTGSSYSFGGYQTSERWGVEQVNASYLTSPIVRDVVGKIAYSVATSRWVLYSVKGKKKGSKAVKHAGAQNSCVDDRWSVIRSLASDGRLTEIESHPVLDLLSGANPQITGFNARRVSQLSLDLSGEMFWLLKYGAAGVPDSYWPIPPHWVGATPKTLLPYSEVQKLARSKDKPKPSEEDGYQITIGGKTEWFGQWEVLWAKDPSPVDPYNRGAGIGQTLGDEIETDEYASKFLKTFFINSGRPELMISVEGAKKEQLEAAKHRYENQFGRFWNGSKAWWVSGKTQVKELTGKLRDMQMVDLRKDQRDIVGTTYGVPPELRGIVENSNRATIAGADYIYQTQVIVPRLEMLRSELQTKLIPLFDSRLVLDYVSPVKEDKEHRLETMKVAAHAITRAEWRAEMGLPDRGPGDDVHHLPPNLIEEPAPKVTPRKLRAKSIAQIDMFGVAKADEILSPQGISNVVNAAKPRTLVTHTIPTQEDQLQAWADAQLSALGVTGAFNLQDPVVQQFLLDFAGDRIVMINDTTKDLLRDALLDGVQRGESQKELARRVTDVMGDVGKTRANTIARTEAKRAANFGRLQSFEQSGVVKNKKWKAVLLNTRDSHLVLHSEPSIPVAGYFKIDSDRSQYPGGFGEPENSINCQCYLSPEMIELKAEGYDWNAFNELVEPWVNDLDKAFLTGFAAQEKDILKALKDNT